ncbi:hypothetical protein CONPUDRAFT_84458 [Coniophora puteana RWD-64-598 SS2]|uniref:GPI anchored protein n=1 Tax=Coniophora puteana (strain RWD-64-598) TaxID=741705 RepID=A0A5M3MDN3_CONPW|nr:uncharacterized protein CONPUDRAFT_84458 [Coniophora puteana RWD-64-598 SS2]EIW77338.1 hypothetical protein CONPUDRAFT_84458 [Coniophora puteana RWD-64-598 SS2]
MLGKTTFASAAVAALLAAAPAAAQSNSGLSIISPGPEDWWVAQSTNTLAWTCNSSPYENFTITIANPNVPNYQVPQPIIAVQYNYDCSESITQEQSNRPAAPGYVIALVNTINSTEVYASATFEIKALGAAYPTSTPSATQSGGASGTGSGSNPSSTGTNGAAGFYIPSAFGIASALALSWIFA